MDETRELWVDVAFALPMNQEFTYRLVVPSGDLQDPSLWTGRRVMAPFRNRQKEGIVVAVREAAPSDTSRIKTLDKVLDAAPLFGPLTLATARWMAHFYFCSLGEALSAMLPTARREREMPPWAGDEMGEDAADHDLVLSDEQKQAISRLTTSENKLFYLKGMTGSGKTEVFLQASRSVLENGGAVLYLVPEIALTWQLRETLTRRFGPLVAVLHSRLTPSQKLKQWRRIQSGEARLVVGARSAVFAPLAHLGLIIVDEEHEGGYKSSNSPRYHARQVAHFLAGKTGARLVMGSATPSLEAVLQMREGKLETLALSRRLAGGAPPLVLIVPLSGSSCLTPTLLEKIHQTLTRGRQVILFLNRRGFSSSLFCRTCGEESLCKNCSVSMTWHKARGILLCHTCGYQTRPSAQCPACGSLDIGWSSIGTEQVEAEVLALFPQARLARLDSDTAEKAGYAEAVVEAFRQGQLDILVGTQMVAKGLNFPKLQLVGLLQADMGLSLPDFRSAERVYNLIRQVSGRAGRFLPDGEVILQTLRPQAPAIALAARGDDEGFWTQELALRQALGFPPYSRLIRLVVRGKDEARVRETAQMLARHLRAQFPGSTHPVAGEAEVLGPAECAMAAVAGNRRWQVIVRGTDFARLHHGVSRVAETFPVAAGLYLEIDADPLAML
ncbi:MAG: primosomal protein N' [Spirochaetales bacterium]